MDMSGALDFEYWVNDDQTGGGKMEITDKMLNPYGTVHAGSMIWFADVVATTTAMGTDAVSPGEPRFPLAINLNTQLFSNRKQGTLKARSTFVKNGRTLKVMRTLVMDEDEKLLLELTSTHLMSK